MPDWEMYTDLRSKLAGPVESFTVPKRLIEKLPEAWGRLLLMSVVCAGKKR